MEKFFRRNNFYTAKNEFTQPKWHRFKLLERGDTAETKWHYKVTAMCGYTYEYNSILGDPLISRADVKTKLLRCQKCDIKEAKMNPNPIPKGDRYANQEGKGL